MTTLKLVTYNLRTLYSHPIDGVNSFIHRAGMILEKIESEKPHVICFQECSEPIRKFLKNYLHGYHVLGHGRETDYSSEGLCVAYRQDCMELLYLEHFWLSPTPYVPGSRYEIQSEYPRICPCVVVKHRDMAQPVKFYDIHLDHQGGPARLLGMRQIIHQMAVDAEKHPFPTFLMGDYNDFPESDLIQFCKNNNEVKLVDISENSGCTFHNFGATGIDTRADGKKIDYIFTDEKTAQQPHSLYKWEDCQNGIYLSDHYPLCCEVTF